MINEFQGDQYSVLEYKLIYSIIVAGKSARFTEGVMSKLITTLHPFKEIKQLIDKGSLLEKLKEVHSGNYTKIEKALKQLIASGINLETCTVEDLEKIYGIGPKTSRFFLLWTRDNSNVAALDVHILRWLRELGYDAPNSTPSGKKYRELELIFLEEANKRNMTARELDLLIWELGSQQRQIK